jgi:uncharacterized protein (TIGR02300 family)
MAKPDLGAKVVCGDCSARFYNLKRQDPECPKCGAVYKAAKVSKPRKAKESAPKVVVPTLSDDETDDVDDEALLLADDDSDDDIESDDASGIMEDTSDLADDDMSEVIVHVDDSEEDRT